MLPFYSTIISTYIFSLLSRISYKKTKIFGILLSECRAATNLSQNCVSSIAKYDHRSLQRVEKGIQIPGVINAAKLVAATGIEIGIFFDLFSKKLQAINSTHYK